MVTLHAITGAYRSSAEGMRIVLNRSFAARFPDRSNRKVEVTAGLSLGHGTLAVPQPTARDAQRLPTAFPRRSTRCNSAVT